MLNYRNLPKSLDMECPRQTQPRYESLLIIQENLVLVAKQTALEYYVEPHTFILMPSPILTSAPECSSLNAWS